MGKLTRIKRPAQGEFEKFRDKEVKEIEKAMEDVKDAKDDHKKATDELVNMNDKLLKVLKKHKKVTYQTTTHEAYINSTEKAGVRRKKDEAGSNGE